MILEGIVTTLGEGGRLNVAPMGPVVEPSFSRLTVRPFRTSQTYRNLKGRPAGVFHVTDDVLLLARAAIGKLDEPPETFPAERIDGAVLASACRWYEFEIEESDDRHGRFVREAGPGAGAHAGDPTMRPQAPTGSAGREGRANLAARVVHSGRIRDFFGFNRAKHAVVEAAILATRVHLLPGKEIREGFESLRSPVEKTAGTAEREAFEMLWRYVEASADEG